MPAVRTAIREKTPENRTPAVFSGELHRKRKINRQNEVYEGRRQFNNREIVAHLPRFSLKKVFVCIYLNRFLCCKTKSVCVYVYVCTIFLSLLNGGDLQRKGKGGPVEVDQRRLF
ncbi:hypothetical protein HanRHA438_Chr10g0468771 [Helianthus annuus]|nr:hypothetical protein HanRHA438_Chr10g0468771 [Helianthus annuus]